MQIADLMLKDVQKRMADMDITVTFTESAKNCLADAGYDEVYGARPLKRVIQTRVEDKIAELLLSNGDKKEITVNTKEGEIVFE